MTDNASAGALLTLQQVAERLQVSWDTVYRLVRAGRLRAYRVGKKWRVAEADLQAYLEMVVNVPTPKRAKGQLSA